MAVVWRLSAGVVRLSPPVVGRWDLPYRSRGLKRTLQVNAPTAPGGGSFGRELGMDHRGLHQTRDYGTCRGMSIEIPPLYQYASH